MHVPVCNANIVINLLAVNNYVAAIYNLDEVKIYLTFSDDITYVVHYYGYVYFLGTR